MLLSPVRASLCEGGSSAHMLTQHPYFSLQGQEYNLKVEGIEGGGGRGIEVREGRKRKGQEYNLGKGRGRESNQYYLVFRVRNITYRGVKERAEKGE